MARTSRMVRDPGGGRDYRSVASIPDLTDDERERVKPALMELIAKYFNTNRSWTKQTSTAIERYLTEARLALPFLSKYENCWPARALGQGILQRRSVSGLNFTPSAPTRAAPARTSSTRTASNRAASTRNTIPRPHCKEGGPIARIPGLSDAERIEFHKVMVEEAKLRLRPMCKWPQQPDDAREDYLAHMSQRLPFLSNYQDAWPADTCIRPWLSNQYYHSVRHKSSSRRPRSPSVVVVSVGPVIPLQGSQDEAATTETVVPDSTRHTRMGDHPDSEMSLREFLANAVGLRAAEEISPILHRGGVMSVEHLNIVARLPIQELEKFLRNDLDLNELQRRLLQCIIHDLV